MIKVTVPALPIRNNSGTSTKTGTPVAFDMDFQTVYVHVTDAMGQPLPFPEKLEITLPKGDKKGYPPGEYTLSPDAIYVKHEKYGSVLAVAPRLVASKTAPRG